jgi:nucleotide-binding universal stress UspA family protein
MTFQSVVIALDGSARAERAIPWVRRLAPKAEVMLIRAIEPDEPGAQLILSEQYLSQKTALFATRARFRSQMGSPAPVILDAADEFHADLIAVTARGMSDSTVFPIGSVTEKLMHASPIPLLIVPSAGADAAPLRKIMVPVDGSKLSEMVLPLAGEISRETGAETILTHIVETPSETEWKAAEIQFPREAPAFKGLLEAVERRRVDLEGSLAAWAEDLRSRQIQARFIVREGKLPDSLLELSRQEGAGLFVMSAHGYGAVKRMLLGSVASKLIRASDIPVILARHEVLQKLNDRRRSSTVDVP